VTHEARLRDVRDHLTELLEAGEHARLVDGVMGVLEQVLAEKEVLELRIKQLVAQLWGPKSERIDPNQLRLAFEALRKHVNPEPVSDDRAAVDVPVQPRSKAPRTSNRRPLPEHLPREERRHVPTQLTCEGCGRPKQKIGERTSEFLEYVPAQLKVIHDVCETWACRCGEGKAVTAPVPSKPVDGGLCGAGLLTQVLVAKYRDHLPANRQAKIYQRAGVDISPNTIVDWIGYGAEKLLQPLAQFVFHKALTSHVTQADDTGILVLEPEGGKPRGKNRHKGHIWAFVGDGKWVAYAYTPDWKKEGPAALLHGRVGWLQADGYKGFDCVYARGFAVEVGCWMHARRPWVKAFDAGDKGVVPMLTLIRDLYDVEARSKEAGEHHAQRLARRKQESAPILEAIEAWRDEQRDSTWPDSPRAKAIEYMTNQWTALGRFMQDGALELDNGCCERALRGIAVGRHNWLFAGSDAGGHRAAIVNTVIETSVAHGLEPWSYLHDVITKLSSGWPNARLHELLPDAWSELHHADAPISQLPRPP